MNNRCKKCIFATDELGHLCKKIESDRCITRAYEGLIKDYIKVGRNFSLFLKEYEKLKGQVQELEKSK